MDAALDLLLSNARSINHHTGKIYGVVPAIVTSIEDKKQKRHEQGCIQIRFPWLQDESDPNQILPWARFLRPGATQCSGYVCYPKIGDEVLVAFEHGDIHHPYVIGMLWNGVDKVPGPESPAPTAAPPGRTQPPAEPRSAGPKSGKCDTAIIRSPSGHLIILDDSCKSVIISDASGQSLVELKPDTVAVRQFKGDVDIWACKKVNIDCEDFIVKASNKIDMVAAKGTCSVQSKGNMSHHTSSNFTSTCDGNMTLEAKGNFKAKAVNVDIEGSGCVTIKAGGAGTFEAGGSLTLKGGPSATLEAGSVTVKGGSVCINGTGTVDITAGSCIKETAAVIKLN